MSENNKGRYVQISNFRNIGVSEKPQNICINRCVNDDFIGNLVLLIGPNNSGKTNVLNALNILNNDVPFKSTDIPNTICNPKEGTYLKLFEDIDSTNVLLKKSADSKKNVPSQITFDEWKNNLKKPIKNFIANQKKIGNYKSPKAFAKSTKIQVKWGTKNYPLVTQFYSALGTLKIDEFINNQWWKTDLGQVIFSKKTNNNQYQEIANTTILNQELIDQLNKIINPPFNSVNNSVSNDNSHYKFLKYQDWKISNSSFTTKYNEPWNPFFVNLLNKLGIKQDNLKSGIGGKQLFYENKVEKGLKSINAYFNQLFKVNGYLYQFNLFFNDTSMNFEINLVAQDSNEDNDNKIIPLDFEEQSTGFQYFFNLYFGLLISQNDKFKKGDVILMDEPGSNLHVEGIIELRNILKKFTQDTGISIILSTHSPFLVDFDYLDEIRLIDRVGGIVDINNNFQFNKEGSSNSLRSITNALATYPNALIKNDNPTFILVEGITDYNYLTGYKVYKINQLNNDLLNAGSDKKDELLKLLHQYETLIFMPFNGLGKNEEDFDHLFKSIDDEYHQRKYKFLIDGDNKGEGFKNKFPTQTINLTELINDFSKIDEKNRTIESLIDEKDKQNFGLLVDSKLEKHSNNSATFKYAMIKGKATEQTYNNFAKLFDNLLKQLNSK